MEKLGSLENPIPTDSVETQLAYLDRLRSGDGQPFLYHRHGSISSPVNRRTRLDIYELISIDRREHWVLAFNPWGDAMCESAPEGLTLAGTSQLPRMGTNGRVNGFPLALAETLGDGSGIAEILAAFTPEEWAHPEKTSELAPPIRFEFED